MVEGRGGLHGTDDQVPLLPGEVHWDHRTRSSRVYSVAVGHRMGENLDSTVMLG